MIVGKICGGLGNQLFQYAFLKSLSLCQNEPFCLDTISWTWSETRRFELDKFNVELNYANKELIEYSKRKYLYREINFSFQPTLLGINQGYFDGYFQSEKYFKHYRNIILEQFTLKKPISIPYQMRSPNSVSISVRRGDYTVGSPKNVHGDVCDVGYYERAIDFMMKRLEYDVHFFVFSDDILWVKNNIKLPHNTTYISKPYKMGLDGNAINDDAHKDLIFISSCSNHIIGNSTFAWWGSWLCTNPNKIIVSPKRWFKHDEKNNQAGDIIPNDWYRV
jgi:hypothetical protein